MIITKYIFITGGVVSGLGKGIIASSLSFLLKSSGLKVFIQKFDPYLNLDAGTMNPYQHGEVFVTSDGAETDLDLGHYERFINENLTKDSNITSGSIYKNVIKKERNGDYKGKTVQVIPHIINEIKNKIYNISKKYLPNIIITEVGGTIGDIESLPFIEAIRQIKLEKGKDNVIFIHVSLVPYIFSSKELKTKPTQRSVRELLSLGIQPDIIFARIEEEEFFFNNINNKNILEKIALFCNIEKENVFIINNSKSIYEVPKNLYKQNVQKSISNLLKLNIIKTDLGEWNNFLNKIYDSKEEIKIKLVGKYIELPDAYLSVIESLKIAGYEYKFKVVIDWVQSENINIYNYKEILKNSNGILVPGGFGSRGFDGKILACKFARENNIPFLGICFGMQAAIIEFSRNICNIKNASSSEISKNNNLIVNIFHKINLKNNKKFGGSLRLGNFLTTINNKNTLAYNLYNRSNILERHRHRYEFNNLYKDLLSSKGIIFSGIYEKNNLVELIELSNHPFFIASQYHPEFTSRPNNPNPLFKGFINAIIKFKKNKIKIL